MQIIEDFLIDALNRMELRLLDFKTPEIILISLSNVIIIIFYFYQTHNMIKD